MIFEPSPLIMIDRITQRYQNGADFIKNWLIPTKVFTISKSVKEIQIRYNAQGKDRITLPLYKDDKLISENKEDIYSEIAKDVEEFCYTSVNFFDEFMYPYTEMHHDGKFKEWATDLMYMRHHDESLGKCFDPKFKKFLKALLESNEYKEYRDWCLLIRRHKIVRLHKGNEPDASPIIYPYLFEAQEKGRNR